MVKADVTKELFSSWNARPLAKYPVKAAKTHVRDSLREKTKRQRARKHQKSGFFQEEKGLRGLAILRKRARGSPRR